MLLRVPVLTRGIRLGEVENVLLDAEEPRILGLEIHCGDGASTRAKLDDGFYFVALGTDISLLENAATAQLALVRAASAAQPGGRH